MKRLLIGLLLLVGISSYAQVLSFEDMKDVTKELNTMCPVMIDSETQWDRIDAIQQDSNIIVQFTYTLVNRIVTNLSDKQIGAAKTLQEMSLIRSIKNNSGLKLFKDNNFTFTFVYYDKNHKIFFIFKITPEKYNTPIEGILN